MKIPLFVIITACLFCASSCFAGSIGPNASPYFAIASNAPFVDITGTGTRVLGHTDDVTVIASLGFSFQFIGGQDYTSAWISSNGVMGFGAPNNSPANVSVTASGVGSVIAPLWDDWQFVTPGTDGVYYETSGDPGDETFTVEWHNAGSQNFLARNVVSFEVTLYQSTGNMLFSYANTNTGDVRTASGASATVGIAGPGDGEYVESSFNQGVVGSNTSILVDPPVSLPITLQVTNGDPLDPSATPVPEPSSIAMMFGGFAMMLIMYRKNILQ
jgi:hypothetical protein